jgi:hypothetical protein
MSTPRGHLRPDKRGRERPPSERVLGRLPGVAEGVAHAPKLAFHHHPRGVRGGTERRRILDDCDTASPRPPVVCGCTYRPRGPPSASSIRFTVQRLDGGQLIPEALSPLLSPCTLGKSRQHPTLRWPEIEAIKGAEHGEPRTDRGELMAGAAWPLRWAYRVVQSVSKAGNGSSAC